MPFLTAARLVCALSIAATIITPHAIAAQQRPSTRDTSVDRPKLSADLELDANNSGTGAWMELTPFVAYDFARRWNAALSFPLYYLNAGSSFNGRASSGVGDVLASLTLDVSSDTNTFSAVFTAGLPTGNYASGFGAGKATWDLTGIVGTSFERASPYLNIGASNNVNVASQAQTSGAGSGRILPGLASGNLVHAEAGVEVDLGRSVYATGSAYGIFASTVTTASAATPVVPHGPRGRLRRPGALGAGQTVISDDSDHGIGGVLWAQVTPAVDLGLWVSHSLAYQNSNTVSITANVNLSQIGRSPRPKG